MKAKFFQTKEGKRYDLVKINMDEYAIKHLSQGHPLRIAFFIDDDEHLEQYQRNIMVVEFGKSIDLEKEEKSWKEKTSRLGICDKSYWMTAINQTMQKVFQAFRSELEMLGFSTKNAPRLLNSNSMLDEFCRKNEALSEIIDIKSLDHHNGCNLHIKKAVKKLNISTTRLIGLAKAKYINSEHAKGLGWYFDETEINRLLEEKPEFLVKIWQHKASLKRKNDPKSIEVRDSIYMGVVCASRMLSLDNKTVIALAESGSIPAIFNKDMEEWLFAEDDLNQYLQHGKPDEDKCLEKYL